VTFIYHIALAAGWAQAQRDGQYTTSTRGRTLAEEGFIHASTADQVDEVADAFYRDAPDLVLLVIDTERVGSPIRYEPVPGQADPYPHIYGPLNLEAVVEVRPFRPPAPRS
jgi:glutathione S-transferase